MPFKSYFFCILFYLLPATVIAQNRVGNQDVAIGYGLLPAEQILDGNRIFFGVKEYFNTGVSGFFSIQYKYFVSKRVTIGLVAGYEKENGDWFYNDTRGKRENWNSYQIGVFSRNAFTIAPELSVAYYDEDVFRLYTAFGMGCTFKNETDVYQGGYYGVGNAPAPGTKFPDKLSKFAGYYSPIAMRFGGSLGGFIELGIGYKGVLNGGVSYEFRAHIKKVKTI